MDNFNNLGAVIQSSKIRTIIYGTYTVAVVSYLILDAFLNGASISMPVWYGGIATALMAASIPVGTLAIANIPHGGTDTHTPAPVEETARSSYPDLPPVLKLED